MSEEGNAKEDLTRFENKTPSPRVTFYNSLRESYPTLYKYLQLYSHL